MKIIIKKILTHFCILFISKAITNERYVCKQNTETQKIIITNFFINDNKIFMSSKSGSGTYDIVENTKLGILALNVSIIGKDYGVESILLNKVNNKLFFKTKLSSDKKKEIYNITGSCSLF